MEDRCGSLQAGDMLTIAQVQQLLPLGRTSIYALCESGELVHYRVGAAGRRRGRILIHRADLSKYLEQTRQARPVTSQPVDVDQILADLRSRRSH